MQDINRRRRSGRPTRHDTMRNSEALLGVATDFFVRHGFGGTTIEAVAQAANVGRQAVYTRFTDKEALFGAVVRRLQETPVFERLALDDARPLAEGIPERLRAILQDAARPEAVTLSKLALREGHRFPDLIDLMSREVEERYIRPLAAYIAGHRRAGEGGGHLLGGDPHAAAALLIDMAFAEITRAATTDTDLDEPRIEAAVARIAALALNGLLRPAAEAGETDRLKRLLAEAVVENAALKERLSA